ncbi:sulfotransferase family protein (plasmid) [Aureibacter tunicatorum]|nr:sulfotransferase family protein [Aureibacter tunicatorum]
MPLSPLAGSRLNNLKKVIEGRHVDDKYKSKLIKSEMLSVFTEPFSTYEEAVYGKQVQKFHLDQDPVFILGHWRSGTTHLHNLMCKDPQFGYVTTYQGVFPNMLFSSQWLFKSFMNLAMPKKRATDNVKLGVNLPQEEEFGLGNTTPHSFYNFWFFPQDTMEYYQKYLMFEGLSDQEYEDWKSSYKKFVNRAMLNTKGKRFISKNPPHTSRVKQLLDIYPNAKFVYIYRNPYTVFESTSKFMWATIQGLMLQDFTKEQLESNILEIYKGMYDKYESEKTLIPDGNLIEIKFEDLEKDNIGWLKHIYQSLSLPGLDFAMPHFEAYAAQQKGYKKNAYNYQEETVRKVKEHWGFALDKWGYDVL